MAAAKLSGGMPLTCKCVRSQLSFSVKQSPQPIHNDGRLELLEVGTVAGVDGGGVVVDAEVSITSAIWLAG